MVTLFTKRQKKSIRSCKKNSKKYYDRIHEKNIDFMRGCEHMMDHRVAFL